MQFGRLEKKPSTLSTLWFFSFLFASTFLISGISRVRSALIFLKVHKNENFFGFDFEFCTFSLLVMSKY